MSRDQLPFINQDWLIDKLDELIEAANRVLDDDRVESFSHIFCWHYAQQRAFGAVIDLITEEPKMIHKDCLDGECYNRKAIRDQSEE